MTSAERAAEVARLAPRQPVASAAVKSQLQTDLTEAMRARDELRVATLRMALAAITKAEVAGKEQVQLSDTEIVGVLRSEQKKRAEAAELYEKGGRADRAGRERAEAEVLAGYLPPAIDDAALDAIVAEEVATVTASGATGGKAMGAVVKAVKARLGEGADGARIAAVVKARLGLG
jgi:hypothetical protein